MTTSMMHPIGYLFLRWRSVVALLGGILAAMVMLLAVSIQQTGAQTTVEPGQNFIVAGDHHSLAVKGSDGTVYAWGGGNSGELGVNSNNDHQVPYQVHGPNNGQPPTDGLNGITDVGAGFYRSLALKSGGTVWAWGDNSDGQLGTGSSLLNRTVKSPEQVYGYWDAWKSWYLTDVTNVDDGGAHSLAVKSNGTVWAWGSDSHCQLAHWSECGSYSTYPVQVKNLPTGVSVVDVVGGGYHSLAIISDGAEDGENDGTVYAWGGNWYGQLGDDTAHNRNTAVQVLGGQQGTQHLSDVTDVAAGLHHSLAIVSDGTADNVPNDGTVYAWGGNNHGQLGINTSSGEKHTPVKVHGPGNDTVNYLTDVTDVAAGEHHSMALKEDGTVYAWGGNGHGQLGIGNKDDHTVPYQVKGPGGTGTLSGITDVEAGKFFSLALKSDGTVWAWGENYNGQLGVNSNNDHTVPYQVHGVGNVGYLSGIGHPTASSPPGGYPPDEHPPDVAICHKAETPQAKTFYVPSSKAERLLNKKGYTEGACEE